MKDVQVCNFLNWESARNSRAYIQGQIGLLYSKQSECVHSVVLKSVNSVVSNVALFRRDLLSFKFLVKLLQYASLPTCDFVAQLKVMPN